jgi:hypothetical protein
MNGMRLWIGMGLLLAGATAVAETYRWVDADGKVHYSDRPVQGAQEIKVQVSGDAPEPPASATTPEEATGPATVNNDTDSSAEIRAQLCNDARERLATYEKADVLYAETAEGRRTLSLDERVDTIVKARQSVKQTCEPPPS